jgi:lambda repressor-like predicted transcriptional regulator
MSLVDGYRAGVAVKGLAIEFGVHRTTVTQHLQRNGVPLRRRGLDDQQVDQAMHLYRQGWSLARVGARLHVDTHTVRTVLRARGVPMRDIHGRDR